MVNAWFVWICGVRIMFMWPSSIEPCKQRANWSQSVRSDTPFGLPLIGSTAFFPVNMSSRVIDLLLKPCCLHHDRRKFVPFQLVNVGPFRLINDITNPDKRKSETAQTLSLCPKMPFGVRLLRPTSCSKVLLFTFLHAVLLQDLRQHWQDFSLLPLWNCSLLIAIRVLTMAAIESTVTWHGVKRNIIEKTWQSTSLLKPGCVPRLQIMKSKCDCLTQYHESQLHWDCVQSWDWTLGAVCTSVPSSFSPDWHSFLKQLTYSYNHIAEENRHIALIEVLRSFSQYSAPFACLNLGIFWCSPLPILSIKYKNVPQT